MLSNRYGQSVYNKYWKLTTRTGITQIKILEMVKVDLSQYGIKDVKKVIYNPGYDELYKDDTKPSLTG